METNFNEFQDRLSVTRQLHIAESLSVTNII
jgi:hypothetical protein